MALDLLIFRSRRVFIINERHDYYYYHPRYHHYNSTDCFWKETCMRKGSFCKYEEEESRLDDDERALYHIISWSLFSILMCIGMIEGSGGAVRGVE
jgi:hypothetical protein